MTPHLQRRNIDVSLKVCAFHYHLIHGERWPLNHTVLKAGPAGNAQRVCLWLSNVCICLTWWWSGVYVCCMFNKGLGREKRSIEGDALWISRHLTERKRHNIVSVSNRASMCMRVCVCIIWEACCSFLYQSGSNWILIL